MVSWLNAQTPENHLMILVVSDDINAPTRICKALHQKGHLVYLVPSAALAIDYLIDNTMPHLIIVDFLEPEIDGVEFVQVSRLRFGRKALAPLVFMMDEKADELAAQVLDVDDVLQKSYNSTALIECVQKFARGVAATK